MQGSSLPERLHAGSNPRAFSVSAVCCNEHSRGFGFAMPPPESGRRMGSGLTIGDCIPDIR
jgi:hypothetical protein